jgi:hypothetical protein
LMTMCIQGDKCGTLTAAVSDKCEGLNVSWAGWGC